MPEERTVDATNTVAVNGNVHIQAWWVDELEAMSETPWPDQSAAEKHAHLREPSDFPVSPFHDIREKNLAVDGFLEQLAIAMDPNGSADVSASHLALGDGTTAPDGTNTTLNNEVYRTFVGDSSPNGRDLVTSTFISQNEMNGEALREIGLTTGGLSDDWALLTHLVLASGDQIDQKTSEMVITINYTIEFRRVS